MCLLSGVPPLPGSESSTKLLLPSSAICTSTHGYKPIILTWHQSLCLSLQGLLQFFCKMSMGFPHYAAQFCAKIVISSIDGRLQSLDPSNRDEFETALESLGQIGL
ncbi:26S proteasome non-ATPase regulatory subunit, partial [Trifolium medium]|nr:26S proteasome non-ATPase regulatory subunit [Trifolium medium]